VENSLKKSKRIILQKVVEKILRWKMYKKENKD
jgi:hypothetical protein